MPLVMLVGLITSNLDYQNERNQYLENVALDNSALGSSAENNQVENYVDLEKETDLMKGGYIDVATAVYPKVYQGQTKEFISRISDNIPLMLLGMALFQLGFFTNGWKKLTIKKQLSWVTW